MAVRHRVVGLLHDAMPRTTLAEVTYPRLLAVLAFPSLRLIRRRGHHSIFARTGQEPASRNRQGGNGAGRVDASQNGPLPQIHCLRGSRRQTGQTSQAPAGADSDEFASGPRKKSGAQCRAPRLNFCWGCQHIWPTIRLVPLVRDSHIHLRANQERSRDTTSPAE